MFIDFWPTKPQQPLGYSGGSFENLLAGSVGAAGQSVTPNSAMRVAAVYACVRVLAETLAQLPLHIYERTPSGKRELPNHPLAYVLKTQPNPWQTGYEWREMMMGHLALRGNAYSQIIPGIRGAATELLPWHPDNVRVERLTNGRLRYQLRQANGTEEAYSQDEIFHLRGLSMDGICGLSPIALLRDPIALSKAAEVYGAKFFANSARPDGMLTTDAVLKADAAEENRKRWVAAHGGVDNSHGTAVMTNGLKWQSVGMTNTDAQFLELRKMEVTEIARGFRVPPHMIADLERSTNNNIEEQSLEFVKYTMAPWLARWEGRIDLDLLADEKQYCKFNFDGLQRGNATARAAYYQSGINNGWLMPNEARAYEDLDPVDGGDVLLVQGAMITLDRAINPPEPPAPAPPPAVDPTAEEKAQQQAARIGELLGTVSVLESNAEAQQRTILELRHAKEHGEAEIAAGKKREASLQTDIAAEAEKTKQVTELLNAEHKHRLEQVADGIILENKLREEIDKAEQISGDLRSVIANANDAAEQLTASALESMARWEATKLRKLAESPKGFLAAVDEYYDYAPKRFSEVIGGPVAMLCLLRGEGNANAIAERSEAHLLNHRQQIVELSGRATPDNLAALVDGCVDGWKNDINSILEN